MKPSLRVSHALIAAAPAFVILLCSTNAHAFYASCEYMTNFSSCDSACNGNSSLTYSSAQIGSFEYAWTTYDSRNSISSLYANNDVWGDDEVEDTDFNGIDYQVADYADMVVVDTHGDNFNNAYGQTFHYQACHQNNNWSCNVDIEDARLGEYFGHYTSPNRGWIRWGMYLTCDSVDSAPDQQWGQTQWYGMDFVMGYRGNSGDVSFTENMPRDVMRDVISSNRTFKAAWLDHADSDWVTGGDTPECEAPGVGINDANSRRDNEWYQSSARMDIQNYNLATSFSWSWTD